MLTPVNLHVEKVGEGPPIILTHGMAVSSATWAAQVELLAKDHAVITWDLRGHGSSQRPDGTEAYSRENVLADFDEIVGSLDAAAGAPVLVGHSLGGYLSLAFALTRPVELRALILLSTGPGYRDDSARAKWNVMITHDDSPLDIPSHVLHIGTQEDALVIDGLSDIKVPTLLIVGERDRHYHGGVSYMERKLADARSVTIPGAGHNPQETHVAEVNAAIEQFLAEFPPLR